jgi:hypothetical protein
VQNMLSSITRTQLEKITQEINIPLLLIQKTG